MLVTEELIDRALTYNDVSREVTGYAKMHKYDFGSNLYKGVIANFSPDNTLVSMKIECVAPQGKFFGFLNTRKLTIEVLERFEMPTIAGGQQLYIIPYIENAREMEVIAEQGGAKQGAQLGQFFVDKIEVNDTNNTSIITAYDSLCLLEQKSIADLGLVAEDFPMTLQTLAQKIASLIKCKLISTFDSDVNITLDERSKINATDETKLVDVMKAIAEVTGTVCHCCTGTYTLGYMGAITFDKIYEVGLNTEFTDTITKDAYFDFKIGSTVLLEKIVAATQLGNNISIGATSSRTGSFTQIIWDNMFLTTQEDDMVAQHLQYISSLLNKKLYEYELSYRGNPYYVIGDYTNIQLKDGTTQRIQHWNTTLEYNGGLRATDSWKATEEENVNAAPSNLGDSIKQTYAKVDKINKEIELVAASADANAAEIAALKINTDSIAATVSKSEQVTAEALEGINGDIATLTNKVETVITPEQVDLRISSALDNGINKVTTETGFTFNEEGLTVSKTGSEMTTQITEDGMVVYRDNTAMLTANNEGVNAANLHATTYLIIGNTSRFEDYTNNGEARTGCFWIGG